MKNSLEMKDASVSGWGGRCWSLLVVAIIVLRRSRNPTCAREGRVKCGRDPPKLKRGRDGVFSAR